MRHLVLALLVVFSIGAPASAQPADPAVEKARVLFEDGTAAYTLGDFKKALVDYEAAYKLYPAPQFLFNIAQCHFQLQNWERAIFFFEGYLREVPDASNRSLVDELITEARQRDAARRDAEKRTLDLERERFELERREKARLAREADTRAKLAVQARVEEPAPVYKKWWFWTAVGGVAAAATITAIAVSGDTTTVLPSGSLGTWDRR
jgi:tetratricopeptide (TPR) repeat protein